jgi:hypothetical protein
VADGEVRVQLFRREDSEQRQPTGINPPAGVVSTKSGLLSGESLSALTFVRQIKRWSDVLVHRTLKWIQVARHSHEGARVSGENLQA